MSFFKVDYSAMIDVNNRGKDMPKQTLSTTVQKTDDAVGVFRREEEEKHWYVAIVNNKSEKSCLEKLQQRLKNQSDSEKSYEVYVAIQQEMSVRRDGKRKRVDRIVFPALLFIRCTDRLRRKEIVYLPYIKRFMVNIAGSSRGSCRPVAIIPDNQMYSLMRMVNDAEEHVTIESRPLHLGDRVRGNGGKLVGLEGNVYREVDGSTSLVVKIDILGCAKVTIARELLEPIVEKKSANI